MSTVQEIESAIRLLKPEELATFREWFVEYDAAAWDRQVERDAHAGRLDSLAEQARSELRSGRCRKLS